MQGNQKERTELNEMKTIKEVDKTNFSVGASTIAAGIRFTKF